MRGQALIQSMSQQATKEQNDAAIALFDQALKIDPNEFRRIGRPRFSLCQKHVAEVAPRG